MPCLDTSFSPASFAHKDAANALRFLSADAVEKAGSGHPGMPMGMADVATVLFSKFIRVNPKDPLWPGRDRFVLSAGHGSMLLYALNYLSGYKDFSLETLKTFRQLHSLAAGHPDYHPAAGIETTTGPLGQGLANGVGLALGQQIMAASFGEALFDHYTYVLAGDGCLMEGLSQEALSLAGHLKLSRLILLFDDNHVSIDGSTDLATSEKTLQRFEAGGWQCQRIDGHDPFQIEAALQEAHRQEKPSLIACRTTIGFGAPHKAGTAQAHGAPLGQEEIAAARQALGWPYGPFEVPASLRKAWQEALQERGLAAYNTWRDHFDALPPETQKALTRRLAGDLPDTWQKALLHLKKHFVKTRPPLATRQSSGQVLEVLVQEIPALLGGSADLTGSNNTRPSSLKTLSGDDFSGRYIHYGVREHGMAALMNGLALYGGLVPYGGTFLVFSDYCRAALRLSALMKLRVLYVMTHDSIGLGEDGATHQPIEHLASLRAMPNLLVFRPADAVEVAECWEAALNARDCPSVLALSRQQVPTLRGEACQEMNLSAKGGYILQDAGLEHQVTLFATGSEVGLALEVREALEEKGVGTRAVSLPCWALFDQQKKAYQDHVLARDTLGVALEAASSFGWERYVGRDGLFCTIDTFGASAPAKDLYAHFGLTKECLTEKIMERLSHTQLLQENINSDT